MSVNSTRPAKRLEYNAVLDRRIDMTSKLAIFNIKPDSSDAYPNGLIPAFRAGQYALIGLNNLGQPNLGKTVRAYSIASAPEENTSLEFYVRYVDEATSANPLTHLLWRMQPGERIHLGPKISGKFTIEDTVGNDDPRLKIFVAAGTGLAPFRSMVKNRLATPGLDDRMVILHGASYPSDLGYMDELRTLADANPRFSYFPTISRPQQAPDWRGDTGRVENFFDPENLRALERRLGLESGGLNPEKAVIYICGLVGTIANTIDKALHAGFVPEQRKLREALGLLDETPSLFFEQYDTTPLFDLKDQAVLDAMLEGTPFEGRARRVEAGV